MGLDEYREKRHFERTPEPEGRVVERGLGGLYVIQKHAARRLHYDLRLEMDGVLKSWAVPKGPSLKAGQKRLAVHVEDHPIEYGGFEGIIPKGEYGGGTVMLWDRGEWEPEGDPRAGYEKGDLKFKLRGEKLKGNWVLARMKGGPGGEDGKNWLLIKKRDDAAISESDPEPVESMNRSAASGRTMEEIASGTEDCLHEREAAAVGRVLGKAVPPRSSWLARLDGKGNDAVIDSSVLPGARPGPVPSFFSPELATPADNPPEGDDWLHEIKYDGYRILCVIAGGRARLISRNGLEWTGRFPEVAAAASRLLLDNTVLDGEVVVMDEAGKTDFQALQNILQGVGTWRLVFLAFDIPYCNGFDLTQTPLLQRKEFLLRILGVSSDVRRIVFADHILGHGRVVFDQACRLSLEGIVSKKVDSPYEQRRSRKWLKVKCGNRQEFVIGGFTDPGGARAGFGALLLGWCDMQGRLVYVGRVGTGFSERMLSRMSERLKTMETDSPPFSNPPGGRDVSGVHWTRPELVCEVEFSGWTGDGMLRHPSFKGLREDKDPAKVIREDATESTAQKGPEPESAAPGEEGAARREFGANRGDRRRVVLTNPNRIFYPEMGVSKKALAEYYKSISARILPHIAGRPLSLVRCPEGISKECFYQKHLGDGASPFLRSTRIVEKEQEEFYSVVDSVEGLIALVQIGVLEIHVWGSRDSELERPDMMVIDLDPAPEVPWGRMIEAAWLLRARLLDAGLTSFLKTTGGKGLHVVTPLAADADWDSVKAFSRAVAEGVVRDFPGEYTATISKEKRKGKIFIDYLRNGRGATSIAPYSTRARRGAPVATPVAWEELAAGLRPDSFTIENIRQWLESLQRDPWEGYFSLDQAITEKLLKLARRAPS